MKGIIILLFSFFYLIISSGFTVHKHYCCGKLRTISLSEHKDEKGCCKGKMKKKGCCHEKTTWVKVKDKQLENDDVKLIIGSFDVSKQVDFNQLIKLTSHAKKINAPTNYHAPPLFTNTPIFIKNREIII